MTRFGREPYRQEIFDSIDAALRAFGLALLRADNPSLPAITLWEKVRNCLNACHFGIAVFEKVDDAYFNPNVSLELGYMMALDRQCLLLKEQELRKLPTDLCGHLYEEFDRSHLKTTILGRVADWLKSVAVRKLDGEKLVVYASVGGQDRCAIAKAITKHLLEGNKALHVRVESRAAFNTSRPTATDDGIGVVRDRLGKDWLAGHRPRRIGPAFLFEADLILAADNYVLSKIIDSSQSYPGTTEDLGVVREEIKEKTFLISEFFDSTGNIEDPFQLGRAAYERCFEQLYALISNELPRLTHFLEKAKPSNESVRRVAFGDRLLFGTSALPHASRQ